MGNHNLSFINLYLQKTYLLNTSKIIGKYILSPDRLYQNFILFRTWLWSYSVFYTWSQISPLGTWVLAYCDNTHFRSSSTSWGYNPYLDSIYGHCPVMAIQNLLTLNIVRQFYKLIYNMLDLDSLYGFFLLWRYTTTNLKPI